MHIFFKRDIFDGLV